MKIRITSANLFFGLLTILGLVFFLVPFWTSAVRSPAAAQQPAEIRTSLLLFSAAIVMILLAILSEAQRGLTVQSIALLGGLIGLNTALRFVDSLIPLPGGFSPVFLLIVLVGFVFGPRLGFLMGALTMLVSDPVTPGGLGPWTPYQMLAAGWAGLTAGLLPRRTPIWGLAILGAAWGWTYGALTNLYFWPYALGAPDLSWDPSLPPAVILQRYGRYYLLTSFAWDTMRALGNLVLIGLLGGSVVRVLERFRQRTTVVWEPLSEPAAEPSPAASPAPPPSP
jgi:energy-coupling factor transport system substrate-specific component